MGEEGVVAEMGGRKGAWREKNDDGLAESSGGMDGDIESRIVTATLGALHAVNDAGAFRVGWAGAADGDAWIVCEFKE